MRSETPKRAAISATEAPSPGERAEGLDLVGGMHRHAHHVLGQRQLAVDGAVADDPAGDGMVDGEHAVLGEVVERGEPAGAGDDGVVLAAVLAGSDGACHEVLKQPVGGDGGLEFGEGGLAGLGPADVGGRALQPVERDGSDDGVVHVALRKAWMGRRPEPSTASGLTPRRTRSISPRRTASGWTPARSIGAEAIEGVGVAALVGSCRRFVEQVSIGERRGLELLC